MFRNLRRFWRRGIRQAAREGGIYFAWRWWTWDQICQGLIAFGGIGSGKSFSTEEYIRQLIASGCPLLSTAVKVDEYQRYERICRELGCLHRLRRITPETFSIDLLGELLQDGTHADAASFLINLGDIEKSGSGGENSAFWRNMEEGALRYAILLARLCGVRPTLDVIYNIILSAPSLPNLGGYTEQKDGYGNVVRDGDDKPVMVPVNAEYIFTVPPGEKDRLFPRLMRTLNALAKEREDYTEFNRIYKFFMAELCATDRIHGSVLAGLNGTLGRFVDRPLRDALNQTTLSPKQIEEERLVCVIDYPLMRYHTAGRLYACIWVMLTQRYLMNRNSSPVTHPFVIVRDEAGWCLHAEWDAKAHNTLRSQKCADIAIVQDLDTLMAALGAGHKAKHEAMAFASNHMHKMFFSSYNKETNDWASHLGGMYREVKISSGQSEAQDFAGRALGVKTPSWSYDYQPLVRSEHFSQLHVGCAYFMSGGRVEYLDFRGKS